VTHQRFRDDGRTIYDFLDSVLVICPQCDARAEVRPAPDATVVGWATPRRLTCAQCGLTRIHDTPQGGFGRPVDPYFGLPLALQAPCAGHVVWAYNGTHLDHLLSFVEGTIRERAAPSAPNNAQPASLVEKMPAWFGAAGNRAAIGAVLRRLRSTLS
jgi:hypothetical protein